MNAIPLPVMQGCLGAAIVIINIIKIRTSNPGQVDPYSAISAVLGLVITISAFWSGCPDVPVIEGVTYP